MGHSVNDLTQARVEALARDTREHSEFHRSKWKEAADKQPARYDFIMRRLTQLFEGDLADIEKGRALVMELDTFDEQVAFAEDMAERVPLSESFSHLGDLAIDAQINALGGPLPEATTGSEAAA